MQSSPFARSNSPQATRGTSTGDRSRSRGRGRGRGRGTLPLATSESSSNVQSNNGRGQRAGLNSTSRGVRGRGGRGQPRGQNVSRVFNTPSTLSQAGHGGSPPPLDPRPEDIKEINHEVIAARRAKLNAQYEQYQQRAIQQKLMSDPDKPEKLENAIFTKGTCTHMCDEKERVDRIFELQLDRAEMLPNPETGQLVPIEGRMVKRFRRAAAGVRKQIPEELRTPQTLQQTMDYLVDNIIGQSQRLAQHHKFVWDRTRAIRNDCSIQSFTQPEDVKLEVDCYERIARFHILSAHLLSEPDALRNGEDFVPKQEIEQLTKTFQTLMDKYDGFGHSLEFPNQAEFSAYFILFAPMTTIADLDDQVQRWPKHILRDGRVQTALKLRATAESTDQPVGSRRFDPVPCFIAQKNAGLYWDLLRSQRVGYLMACVAEMSFRNIRFAALDSLWRAGKNAPEKGRAAMRTWTKAHVREYLGFDNDSQVEEFCSNFGVNFVSSAATAQQHLDFNSHSDLSLEYASLGQEQVFSSSIVEQKRQGRTLVAVLNGMSIAEAAREGLIIQGLASIPTSASSNKSSMFVSQDADDDNDDDGEDHSGSVQSLALNPQANVFTPANLQKAISQETTGQQPSWKTQFGQPKSAAQGASESKASNVFASPINFQQNLTPTPAPGPASNTTQVTWESLGTASNAPDKATQLPQVEAAPQTNFTPFARFAQFTSPAFAPQKETSSQESSSTSSQIPAQPGAFQFAQPAKPQVSTAQKSIESKPPQPDFSWTNPLVQNNTPSSSTASNPIFESSKQLSKASEASNFSFDSSSATSSPPIFKFASSTAESSQPKIPTSSPQIRFTPSSINQPSVPSIQPSSSAQAQFKFPPVSHKSTELLSTTPSGSPARTSQPSEPSTKSPGVQSNTSVINPVLKSDPIQSQTQAPTPPQRKPVDKNSLVEHLCRIGLTQKDGILDMFVANKVSNLCLEVFRSFQTQQFERKIAKLRARYLKRKFCALWITKVHHKRLVRRAEKRKKMFAASVRAQQEKEMKRQEEVAVLNEIAKSEENKRRIQQEQERQKNEKMNRIQQKPNSTQQSLTHRAGLPTRTNASQSVQTTDPEQKAGQKRKLHANSQSRSRSHDIAMSPMHKRSRTLGSSTNELRSTNSSPSKNAQVQTLSASNNLRRSLSHRSLRQSLTQQGVDQTEGDYFRLKALGIDPNTPLVPDTSVTLAAKEKRAAEHRESVLSKIKFRPGVTVEKSPSEEKQTAEALQPVQVSSKLTSQQLPTTAAEDSDDPFLLELRKAHKAMGADAEWLRKQTVEIEKELEQQEETRRRSNSIPSVDNSFMQSTTGMAMSISGYEYVAPVLKTGQTLSRTEQRIRATGAHGLATTPLGMSPRPTQSRPIAMSRKSAAQYQDEHVTRPGKEAVGRRKRSIDQMNNGSSDSAFDRNIQVSSPHIATGQIAKKPRSIASLDSHNEAIAAYRPGPIQTSHQNGYNSASVDEATEDDADETGDELQYVTEGRNGTSNYGYDEEEEYSDNLDDHEDEDTEDETSVTRPDYRKRFTEHEYAYEDGQFNEYDEDEEEEDEEQVDNVQRLAPSAHGSRAVSASVATPDTGLGSTVEDAIELSD